LAGILVILLAAGGCKRASSPIAKGKLTVVSVIFPSYDFVRVIAGDRVNLVMLLPPGAESHSYEPSPRDIVTIEKSDLFIYPGGDNYAWADRILDSMDSPAKKMKPLKLMDLVDTVKEEEQVEGMEPDKDAAEAGPAYDEHVWTSPKNAKSIVAGIAEALCALYPGIADFYR